MTLNYADKRREVKIPDKDTTQLAEFFGILTGDGYIGKYGSNYVIEIAGNKFKDKEYLENHVSNLIYLLFNLKPNIYFRKDQNTMYAKIQSKLVLQYLISKGFKMGFKGRIDIPSWVKNNNELMISFAKGLFDTDGCLSLKRKEGKLYPTLSIASKSDLLITGVRSFLMDKEISSYFATYKYDNKMYKKPFIIYQVQVNGYKNVNSWFSLIGSENKRNISKFNDMLKFRELKKL